MERFVFDAAFYLVQQTLVYLAKQRIVHKFFSLDTRHHSVSYRFLFGQLLATQCLQFKVLTAFCFPSLIASVMSQSLIYLMTLIASAALEGKQTSLLDVASWGPPLIDTKKQFNSLRTWASHINNAVYILLLILKTFYHIHIVLQYNHPLSVL